MAKSRLLKTTGIALLGGALGLQGAGLWLYERGTPDSMTAVAGRAASALDASTAVSNPAGMTRLEKNELVLGLQPVYMDFQFDPSDGTTVAGDDGGQAGGFTPAGGFYMVHPLTDRLRLGFSNFSAYGAAQDFGDEFVGRYTIMNANLLTMTAGSSLGYRVNDWLSVGAGAYLTYAMLDQDIAVPRLGAGDGTVTLEDEALGYCGSLGLLFHPCESLRIGVAYTTETKLKFEDVLSARGLGAGQQWLLGHLGLSGGEMDMEMTMPQGVMVSVYQDLNERWAILANVGWQDSSEAGKMDVDIDAPAGSVDTTLDRKFDDTYHVALGARCRLNEKWTWGFGVAHDTSPVDDEDRTVDMALDRQWRYATGLEYALSESKTIGVAYTFLDLGEAGVDQTYPSGDRLVGDFDHNYVHIVTLTWGLKF
jgi:long-chain fatty acid transport protein